MLNVVADLSHYNAPVNFAQAAQSGLRGVVHKATEGLAFIDPTYAVRRPQALAAGLLWGAYHFGRPGDGAAQARHFLATVGLAPGVLLMLDLEAPATGSGMSTAEAEAFVQAVRAATGRYPGLYGPRGYLGAIGADRSPVLTQCWLWLADYNAVPAPAPLPPWPVWTMWQYTDGQHGNPPHAVPGLGPCDRSLFNGELPGLHALWSGRPAAAFAKKL